MDKPAQRVEEWANIPGYAGYGASSEGHIINLRTGRILAQRRAGNGSMQINIGKSTAMVHDLVARAYYGHPRCRGYHVKNANGDRSDNRPDNLVWTGRPPRRKLPSIPMPTQAPILGRDLQIEYARAVREREYLIDLMQS